MGCLLSQVSCETGLQLGYQLGRVIFVSPSVNDVGLDLFSGRSELSFEGSRAKLAVSSLAYCHCLELFGSRSEEASGASTGYLKTRF